MGAIEKLITKFAVQTAVYWGNPQPDGYGGMIYDTPREIKIRWDDSQNLGTKNGSIPRDQENTLSDAKLLTVEDLEVGGLIWLGTLEELMLIYNNTYQLEWSDIICVSDVLDYDIGWSEIVCLRQTIEYELEWTNEVCEINNEWVLRVSSGPNTETPGYFVFTAINDISDSISKTGADISFSVEVVPDGIYYKHTVAISINPSKVAYINIDNTNKIISLGDYNGDDDPIVDMYSGVWGTMPTLTIDLDVIPQSIKKIRQSINLYDRLPINGTTALPEGLTYLHLEGWDYVRWDYTGALPIGLTHFHLYARYSNFNYTGALPVGLKYFLIAGNSSCNIVGALPEPLEYFYISGSYAGTSTWIHTGGLPSGLKTFIVLATVDWTYEGALPETLEVLRLHGGGINWTYSGSLIGNFTHIEIGTASVDWTGLEIIGNNDLTVLWMLNFRTVPMTSPEMLTLINSLIVRVGGYPETIAITDYVDKNSPPQYILDAKALLLSERGTNLIFA